MRQIVRMPSLANVTAGGTATLNMPVGRTYEKLTLKYTGVPRSKLTDIRLLVDGKPILEFASAEQLAAVNKYYGRHDEAGYITIYFVRPEMNSLDQQRVTGLGTGLKGKGVIQTLQLECDIGTGADVVSPTIEARAVQSDPKPMGVLNKVKAFVYSSATAGQFEIDSIPKGPRIAAIHFIKAAGDITRIEVEQNSRKIVEGDTALLKYMQRESGRVPQATFATVDWMQEGDLGQSLVTSPQFIQDQRFRLTLGTAGVVNVLVEYLDGYGGI